MPVITANFSKSSSSELSFEEAMLNFDKHTLVSTRGDCTFLYFENETRFNPTLSRSKNPIRESEATVRQKNNMKVDD